MTTIRPISDEDLADMAPHIAERAQADLRERAENAPAQEAALDAIYDACQTVEPPKSGRKSHGNECWRECFPCFVIRIERLTQGG